MTVLEKHTRIDYLGALLEEISLLVKLPVKTREKMNVETFDPLDYTECFLGQLFDSGNSHLAIAHRNNTGTLKAEDFEGYDLSPLEIWSARLWKKGEKEPVLSVFNAIKTGTPLEGNIQWVE